MHKPSTQFARRIRQTMDLFVCQRSLRLVCYLLAFQFVVAGLWWNNSLRAEEKTPHLVAPRILPLGLQESPAHLERLEQSNPKIARLNIIRTMAQHPELHKAWSPFAGYILRNSSLSPRDRELVVLRVGWLCQAEYEWSQHSVMARAAGVTEEEISQVIVGPDGDWSEFDRTLLKAVDELHATASISDGNWNQLRSQYTQQQMMDLVFTVGQYNMVSMALNSFGVAIDEGYTGFPE